MRLNDASDILSHACFIALIAACLVAGRSSSPNELMGHNAVFYVYAIVLIAYIPLLYKVWRRETFSAEVDNTDLTETHPLIHDIFYRRVPYLNPLFFLFNVAQRISPRQSTNDATRSMRLPFGAVVGRRASNVVYLLGNALLLWVCFGYLTSPHNSVFNSFLKLLGTQVGFAMYLGLLILVQFTVLFDLLLTIRGIRHARSPREH